MICPGERQPGGSSNRRPLTGDAMVAYNVVRFRVKPGREQDFIAAHRSANPNMPGFKGGALI